MDSTRPAIDPQEFVELVQPLLERRDLAGLVALVKERWAPEQIYEVLNSDHLDARKVALLGMSLVGQSCCLPQLAQQLPDPDPIVREMAEHALWSIWFRLGNSPEANHQLGRGAMALERKDLEHAIEHFTRALELDPEFAEAYNQRAIAEYLLDRYEASIRDCEETVKRMPMHFGALAGMGHGYLHLGNVPKAIESYERALLVHPHLECIRESVRELRQRADA